MSSDIAPPYPSAPSGVPTNNPAGRASLIVAAVIVVLGLAQQTASYLLPTVLYRSGLGASEIGGIFGVFGFVIGALAIAAVILGALGLSRQGAPKAAAGAGTAIGASSLLSVIFGLFAPLLITLAG